MCECAEPGTGTFFVIDLSFIRGRISSWFEFKRYLRVIYTATKKLLETGPRVLLNPPIDKNIIYYYWFIQFGWTMTIALHRTYSVRVRHQMCESPRPHARTKSFVDVTKSTRKSNMHEHKQIEQYTQGTSRLVAAGTFEAISLKFITYFSYLIKYMRIRCVWMATGDWRLATGTHSDATTSKFEIDSFRCQRAFRLLLFYDVVYIIIIHKLRAMYMYGARLASMWIKWCVTVAFGLRFTIRFASTIPAYAEIHTRMCVCMCPLADVDVRPQRRLH